MSELLEKAAAALGLPQPLVQRSAAARAAETGADVDEILAAWAGGEAPAPAAAAPEEAEPEVAEAPVVEEAEPEAEEEVGTPAPAPPPEVVVEVPEREPLPAAEAPAAAAARPPVLVGAQDNPIAVLSGIVGLFLVVVLVGLVGPALPSDPPGARSSELPYSELALEGRAVYANLGCAFCHTQMVRPVVADVGLGAVTLSDSNQVLGARRFGPDLSDVGTRLTAAQIEAIVGGSGGHPPHILAAEDLAALVGYLSESKTSAEQAVPDDEAEEGDSEEEPEA